MSPELPLVVFPRHPNPGPLDWSREVRACADRYLQRVGCILFRGFRLPAQDGFRLFADSFGPSRLIELDESQSPLGELRHARTSSGGWPLRLWLHHRGGAACSTLLSDGREVFRRIPARLRARFMDRGLIYVHDFVRGQPPGEDVFGLDRLGIEGWCRKRALRCEWRPDGGLRTRQHIPAAFAHPLSGALVWFHPTSSLTGGSSSVSYGDGTAIEAGALAEIQGIVDDATSLLEWEDGDVLLIDNLLVAHAPLGLDGGTLDPPLGSAAPAPLALCADPQYFLAATGNTWVQDPCERRSSRSPSDVARCP